MFAGDGGVGWVYVCCWGGFFPQRRLMEDGTFGLLYGLGAVRCYGRARTLWVVHGKLSLMSQGAGAGGKNGQRDGPLATFKIVA